MIKRTLTRQKQQGAFLLTVMIAIIAMVFSGLLVMEVAMLEEATVSNEQRTVEVYQVANTELEAQLAYLESNTGLFFQAISAPQTLPVQVSPGGCGDPAEICQSVTLRYMGQGVPPPGYSLGSFVSMMYEIDSVATIESTGARSSQTMGVVYVTQSTLQ